MDEASRHWYSPKEFADRFCLSRSFVYLMIRRGDLKAAIIGGVYRIPKKEYCRNCQGMNGCRICLWSRS